MQPTNRSSRILLPVKFWFVWLSLIVAVGLRYIPTGLLPAVPDWVALVLAFWCIREPLKVGMGTAFLLGLLVDIGLGAAMGQHALAYVVIAYLATALSRRVLWFPPLEQALHVLPLLLIGQMLMVLVRLVAGAEFPGWWYFLSSFSGAVLWVPLTFLLLLPQYQPVERDEHRPI
ncbi:rod shape-determining protein MreD [Pseudothauera rhizosphaerae]|uniref:Rod shape-determining protein MreD n=1 Tax=Pseudothauera rhizosphaerae TaxID=2565932 RepID=A0A4S4AU39_9RHOO|nr:rod shape-determining protein MreD [Pseudothauera rhizosphaerae]THF62105.1 rod shape-determining protein MreD [Pseudothauera rhizosphaerae]